MIGPPTTSGDRKIPLSRRCAGGSQKNVVDGIGGWRGEQNRRSLAGMTATSDSAGDALVVPFDAENGLVLAVRLPGSSEAFGPDRLGWDRLQNPDAPPPLWIHLDLNKSKAQQWLRERTGLDPIVAESLLAEETRPRIQPVDNGLLVILRGVNMNPGAQPDELITIRLWVEPTRIITLRQHRFQTISDLRIRAQQGAAPKTSGSFLAAVATGLSARMGPAVENLEDMLDAIEETMLDSDTDRPADRAALATIRRQAITLRRYVVPQRDALLSMTTGQSPLFSPRDLLELRVAAEQVTRVCEALEELRDRAAVTQEEMRGRNETRMGRTLYMLAIVATIALPLSLITGLLGINVGGIPLAESHAGFIVVCAAMVIIGVIEFALFKAMRWL